MLKIISKPQPDCLHLAGQHACKLLLNCYIRELGQERPQQIVVDEAALAAVIRFPNSGMTVKAQLSYYSAAGEHEYASLLWSGDGSTEQAWNEAVSGLPAEGDWEDEAQSGKYVPAQQSAFFLTHQPGDSQEQASQVSHYQLLRWIIAELSADQDVKADAVRQFMSRVDNSVRNMALYMQYAQSKQRDVSDYQTSEQGLVCGHPFHPFPKSTVGFGAQDKQRYSPELGASFQLCYMAVHRDCYHTEWVDEQAELQFVQVLNALLQELLSTQPGIKADEYALLPMHPWQYEHVQQLPDVQQYVERRMLIPLGAAGSLAYPTSSVRTVYIPDMNCNMKLPLNIQITNLTRNNSEEQMKRTLEAARYVLDKDGFAGEAGTHIAYEKGIGTCTFADEMLTRLFTVAYRPIAFDPSCTYVLSSLVESHVPGGVSQLVNMLKASVQNNVPTLQINGQQHTSDALIRQAERWLQDYLELSLLPIVRIAEQEGIHFEAHLQNTLVTLYEGMPKQFIIRDLEGVSVEEQHGRQHVSISSDKSNMSAEPHHQAESQQYASSVLNSAQQPKYLFYDQQSARNRTTYYFIVNHLGSLIHVLARDTGCREQQYWRIAQSLLEREQEQTGNTFAAYLLQTDAFLAKQNLRSCLQGHGDTPDYVYVTNRLKSTEE
ncbi:IucA/IucC family protein [Paenibacillus sp. WLX1005]|uniref:IucA/IucC family protein n=1 Tax=Paenibacillus sp. WLX1005 TaxID=3243766 RepID=UPI003983F856